jgi:SAM-dependent methyltransferase
MGMRMPAHRMVRPYSLFAATYDATVGVPFFRRTHAAFEALVSRYGLRFGSAADLGCGTGLFARYLNRRWGIPVFGVDHSPQMLAVAAREGQGCGVTLLQQDVRCLSLPFPVDLMTINFDTLNHIVRPGEVQALFRRIAGNLRPGGHLFFDAVTHCFPWRGPLAFVRRFRGSGAEMVHQIRWDPLRRLVSITVIHRSRACSVPTVEVHQERSYTPRELGRWLLATGFVIRGVHDADTLRPATGCPPRIIVVATKRPTDRRQGARDNTA